MAATDACRQAPVFSWYTSKPIVMTVFDGMVTVHGVALAFAAIWIRTLVAMDLNLPGCWKHKTSCSVNKIVAPLFTSAEF